MDDNKVQVIEWLSMIIDDPEGWYQFYSDSEIKTLAEYAMKLIGSALKESLNLFIPTNRKPNTGEFRRICEVVFTAFPLREANNSPPQVC